MKKKKILIIDDDQKLNDLLVDYFTRFDFLTLAIPEPVLALKRLDEIRPDIIVLDIMMPGMDGFDVCRQIRKHHSIPIIMLTARGDVADRVVGLELGADDYVPKPFEPRELVARIQTVLRRSDRSGVVDRGLFGDLEIDYQSHTVSLKGKPIELTTMEFLILSIFTKNPGIVLDRDMIFEKLKGLDADSFDRSIDVLISRLRNKIHDDPKKPSYLKTIWGAGYKFIGKETGHD